MAILEVKNLSAGYTEEIVHHISFTVEPGEIIGILGRNGCGKTTLLRALTGSIRVKEGTVLVDGHDCRTMKPRQRAEYLSHMTQRLDLMEGIRAGELICMGRYAHGGAFSGTTEQEKNLCRAAAERLGILDLWDRDCAALSEGQRQLVQLASVTAQDARVLLLDEPSSALDFDNSHRLFRHVRELTGEKHKCALVVIHDPVLALNSCDRLLRLEQGVLTGTLSTKTCSLEEVQTFLDGLYPGILVRRDLQNGAYYCIMN